MKVGVHRLHVVQRDGFSQQLLVEGQREASIDVVAVEHSQAHDAAHKMEVGQVLLQVKHSVPRMKDDDGRRLPSVGFIPKPVTYS